MGATEELAVLAEVVLELGVRAGALMKEVGILVSEEAASPLTDQKHIIRIIFAMISFRTEQ